MDLWTKCLLTGDTHVGDGNFNVHVHVHVLNTAQMLGVKIFSPQAQAPGRPVVVDLRLCACPAASQVNILEQLEHEWERLSAHSRLCLGVHSKA